MGSKIITTVTASAVAFAVLGANSAIAHPGHDMLNGLGAGFVHPIIGIDHMAVMALVGVWGGMIGGKARFLLPLAFVATLALGAVVALAGFAVPMFEVAILTSIVALGLLVAFNVKVKTGVAMLAVSAFAVAHGFAHGVEMPHEMGAFTYGAGFVAASALLHAAGLTFGRVGLMLNEKIIRVVGGLTAAAALFSMAV